MKTVCFQDFANYFILTSQYYCDVERDKILASILHIKKLSSKHFRGISKGKGAQWERQHFAFLPFLLMVSYGICDRSVGTLHINP